MTKNGARKPGRPAVGVGDEAVCGAANDDATATETSDVTPIEVVASERPSTEAVELQQVELQQEVSDLKGQLQRKQAELINFRRRTQKEQAANAVKSRGEMVLELLPIIDDFERAVSVKSDSARELSAGYGADPSDAARDLETDRYSSSRSVGGDLRSAVARGGGSLRDGRSP